MHFGDEVVPASRVPDLDVKAKVDGREMKMAEQLIDSLTGEFDPSKYHDGYREKVMELIDRKAHGGHVAARASRRSTRAAGRT